MRRLHTLYAEAGGFEVDHPGMAEIAGVGEEFLESVEEHVLPGPLSRGRPYARNGAIRELARDGDRVQADVKGSGATYDVVILGVTDTGPFRLRASCDCPYSCAPGDCCKQAIAVSFAVAALLDGRVVDEGGRLGGPAPEVDRAELVRAVAALKTEPRIDTVVDVEQIFREANRWLAFPGTGE